MAVVANNVRQNGNRQPGPYDEIGTSGLEAYSGFVARAYNSRLYWPGVEPLYSRIWRSDPETTIVRHLMSAWAGELSPQWEVPELVGPDGNPTEATDDDRKAAYFANTVMRDIEDGIDAWLQSAMARVPFFGWGFWEAPLGLRRQGWQAPDGAWESEYDDGLVGIRRLAFREYSSFLSWEMDDATGRVTGLEQLDPPNPSVVIPSDRAVHVRYGDLDNPEGLATLEAIWRLERLKYGLEVVQGIGYEHAAGHAKFTVRQALDSDGKAAVSKAARALMTAQEGNYITELMDDEGNAIFTADVMDVPFAAAGDILEAIRYYGILKLALFGMQFVAMSSMSGSGSYAALSDASEMALLMFNNIASGVLKQGGRQLAARLFSVPANRAAFPQMTRLPELKAPPVQKRVALGEFGAFLQAIDAIMPLSDEDYITIRKRSEVLPETLPEDERAPDDRPDDNEPDDGGDDEAEPADLAQGTAYANLQQATPEAEAASRAADALNEEMREIYEAWLFEHEAELADDPDRERLAFLLGLLLIRVRRRATLRMAELAERLDATPDMMEAMQRQMEGTLAIFEDQTLPDLREQIEDAIVERRVSDEMGEVAPALRDRLTGFGARVSLAGGILWTMYQEAKKSLAVGLEARWTGPAPGDPGICDPCAEQMKAGWRPVERVPTPGPEVCLGLTNCRHSLEFKSPITGRSVLTVDELRAG